MSVNNVKRNHVFRYHLPSVEFFSLLISIIISVLPYY